MTCDPCEPGTYSADPGATLCDTCPPGKTLKLLKYFIFVIQIVTRLVWSTDCELQINLLL